MLSGKKPTNVKGAEKPLRQKAFKNAQAPGMIEYFISFFKSSSISSLPGSEMQGVPASLIKAIFKERGNHSFHPKLNTVPKEEIPNNFF